VKTKAVYVNETLVGEVATWAAVYKLVSDKGVTFVGTPDTAEGPAAFFLRGQVDKSRQSLPGVHSEVMPTMTPTDFGASMRAKAIARGLINTERAAKRLHLDNGMLRLECLSGGYYWISLDGRQLHRGSAFLQADELQSKFIEAMERAGQ
jgi:hypothetical protein